jgi:hypothetical protein
MGRASRSKSNRRASRPRPDVAGTVERLEEYVRRMEAAVPGWANDMDRTCRGRGAGLPDWPEWCLVPLAGAYAVVAAAEGSLDLPVEDLGLVAAMGALYAWCQGRDIWRFDPELASAVIDTDLTGPIPAEVLYRMPGWCVYLVDPACEGWPAGVAGAWCHLEWDCRTERTELRIVLDLTTGQPLAVPLHIEAGRTVHEMLEAADRAALAEGHKRGIDPDELSHLLQGGLAAAEHLVGPVVALLLYLCAENADVRDPDRPGAVGPRRRRSPRLEGPVRTWEVGYRVATALRSARTAAAAERDSTGRHVAPHLRRAHWHTYYRGEGSRSDPARREVVVRWLSPIAVGTGEPSPVLRVVRAHS